MTSKGAGAITVLGTTSAEYSAALNTTITPPSGIQTGDLLLAFVGCGANGLTGLSTSSSGWTRQADAVSASGNSCIALFSKVATGSDALVVTAGVSRAKTAIYYRIQNANTCVATAASGTPTGVFRFTPSSVSLPEAHVFTCLAAIGISSDTSVISQPSGYGALISKYASASYTSTFVASRSGLTGITEGPGYWSLGSNSYKCATVTAAVYQS
jgi:hypothetical protein